MIWRGDQKQGAGEVGKYSEITPSDKTDYDFIILSGGHTFSVIGHDSNFSEEINLIHTTNTPILGICLGFELIAYSYGAWLEKLDSKENKISPKKATI